MLARTPFTEIEIEDVGFYRLPSMWHRIKRVKLADRGVAIFAFGCGMTVRQFRKPPADKQALGLARSSGAFFAIKLLAPSEATERAPGRARRIGSVEQRRRKRALTGRWGWWETFNPSES
ncbi:hypothetical protein FJV76_19180 [Mesorhizobium sp. WSM4303]|uniref:hypothetical protein n=1 Tax=unclassified Mesorhizobium TaxID=325217 RepID=UPI00115F128A|nr:MULTISPECIES: hypothetical protein [unclassified Mesorhizobium]TRC93111.1 hypothetical protein FJV77_23090 [Mesorhizobium sp. WSM4306]TRD02367.1 hypothetical protein FJV76_19180 [Mesorhizobium sp. WSM4303]